MPVLIELQQRSVGRIWRVRFEPYEIAQRWSGYSCNISSACFGSDPRGSQRELHRREVKLKIEPRDRHRKGEQEKKNLGAKRKPLSKTELRGSISPFICKRFTRSTVPFYFVGKICRRVLHFPQLLPNRESTSSVNSVINIRIPLRRLSLQQEIL